MVAPDAVGHLTVYALLLSVLGIGQVLEAPVYTAVSPNVLRRSGTLQYQKNDEGYIVQFCVATPPRVMLRCVVTTPEDLLVFIEIPATEHST